jgi:hypothetical protein
MGALAAETEVERTRDRQAGGRQWMVGNLSARVRRLEEKRQHGRMVFVVRDEEDPPHPDEGKPWCFALILRQLDPGAEPSAVQTSRGVVSRNAK